VSLIGIQFLILAFFKAVAISKWRHLAKKWLDRIIISFVLFYIVAFTVASFFAV
jgi:hypothetical protein